MIVPYYSNVQLKTRAAGLRVIDQPLPCMYDFFYWLGQLVLLHGYQNTMLPPVATCLFFGGVTQELYLRVAFLHLVPRRYALRHSHRVLHRASTRRQGRAGQGGGRGGTHDDVCHTLVIVVTTDH